jgi:hypothetical protein
MPEYGMDRDPCGSGFLKRILTIYFLSQEILPGDQQQEGQGWKNKTSSVKVLLRCSIINRSYCVK